MTKAMAKGTNHLPTSMRHAGSAVATGRNTRCRIRGSINSE